jgi:quercetin dioxygenase-like cupin family protein
MVYAMAGGNHVTIVIDALETDGAFDLVEVYAQPGGGPPPHKHAFAEWFHVVEGTVQFLEPSEDGLRETALVRTGETFYVPPWAPHATHNTTDVPARFMVAGRPGVMSSYFAQAGIAVPDILTPPSVQPPGPAQLVELAARYGIEYIV